ncbi:nuclear transport factor 2 family protein [Streptomyces sp. NBRC 109706]|uniref:nuclear transport factor 2 family protein n=1 Tax=Streptomyces sp. NBRC 109706 TaxID=1550035 RepID=UPI000782F423|nr:nuclear transport factor 2 family protein [Streptomyces sp. NBRC 109706]
MVTERSPLRAYIDGWRRHDVAAVLGELTDDCVVVECYGPVYRGLPRVEQWMRAWLAAGGTVDGWEITSEGVAGELVVAEWRFSCTWQGSAASFEGATVARLRGGRISRLREYETSAPLYDWTGSWRE